MSIYKKSSAAIKKKEEDSLLEIEGGQMAEVIPFPDIQKIIAKKPGQKKVRLEGKYLHYRGKKVPLLQFQKSGYDKLLKLLVKEIG
ncbi:MAG: hypothetical protein QHH14_05365 [Clostridiales bacterium]|jgi:hypothetical protein|nr:hypothetical protein [Clostridiales bacterium]